MERQIVFPLKQLLKNNIKINSLAKIFFKTYPQFCIRNKQYKRVKFLSSGISIPINP